MSAQSRSYANGSGTPKQQGRSELSLNRESSVETLCRTSNSNSQDIIASAQTGVELVKFNNLPVDCDSLVDRNDSKLKSPLSKQFGMLKSLSAGSLISEAKLKERKEQIRCQTTIDLPWSVSETPASKRQGLNSKLSIISESNSNSHEPFQVVWRKLSFEVEISTYDQIISRSFNKLASCLLRRKGSRNDAKNLFHLSESGGDPDFFSKGRRKRVIFDNLNGYFKSGETTAILGPSGAGKTSLLNAICGFSNNYRGTVQLIGGGKRRMRVSIIPQKDYLEEHLTVRENLLYSSRILNLDKNFDHEANIMRVVKMLNLMNCFNSVASSISGGEYKRVSIAQELLRQPDIMILDEPTSGLDSLNCKNLIKSLNELIKASKIGKIQPIAIVMTIHQPDVDVFSMFSHVYCMARGGRVIFDGDSSNVMETLRSQAGFSQSEMPPELVKNSTVVANPANLLIEIASEQFYGSAPVNQLAAHQLRQFESTYGFISQERFSPPPSPTESQLSSKANSMNSLDPFKKSDQLSPISTRRDIESDTKGSLISLANFSSNSPDLSISNGKAIFKESRLVRDKRLAAKIDHSGQFWHHTWILAKRELVATMRDPFRTLASFFFHLLIPIVMYNVYGDRIGKARACPIIQRSMDMVSLISNNTATLIADQQDEITTSFECGTMYFLTSYSFSMCAIAVSVLAFPLSMHILLKEYRNGWYKLSSYVIAKTVSSLPLEIIPPTISIVMVYYMLGMPSSYMEWRLWLIALVLSLMVMVSTTHGLICGALFLNSVQTAIFIAIASTLPLVLLSNYTGRIAKMPTILQYSSWASVYRYSTDTINIVRFGYGMCPCDETTENYLSSNQPKLIGISSQLQPWMSYYLSTGGSATNETETVTTLMPPTINGTVIAEENVTDFSVENLAWHSSHITGLTNDLLLEPPDRSELMTKIESNEIDLFSNLAKALSRSFTYGREINNCSSLRSQLLESLQTPPDDVLPYLIGGLVCLLIVYKIVLIVVVKYRVSAMI